MENRKELSNRSAGPSGPGLFRGAAFLICLAVACWVAPVSGFCAWDTVCELASDSIRETPGLGDVPELVLENQGGNMAVLNAIRRSLTARGYRVAFSGRFPSVEVVRHYQRRNRFWERPYVAYVLELRIMDGGKIIRQLKVPHIEAMESPYQLPIRIFLALITAFFLYGLMVALSLHKNTKAWLVSVFIWVVLLAFLAQGYFYPQLFL